MVRTDEDIKKDVVDHLYLDDRIDASQVTVQVNAGVVTLGGALPSYFARSAALEDAWAASGVTDVRNETTVRYRPAVSPPPDEEIAAEVERKLDLDPDIDVLDMDVEVTGGMVTLRGTVDAFWKKVRSEWLVGDLRGVVGIENSLAVVPSHEYLDKDIARTVMDALEREVLVDSSRITVRVDRGVVDLSGTVPSWAVRDAVYRAASVAPGVSEVRDSLDVSGLGPT